MLSLIYDNAEETTYYFLSFLLFFVSSLISSVVLN